jgi:DNA-binding CsgD family transcriptional regulator
VVDDRAPRAGHRPSAKRHLENVYRHTGVSSRGALAALVLK